MHLLGVNYFLYELFQMKNHSHFGTPNKESPQQGSSIANPRFLQVKLKIDSLLAKDISLINQYHPDLGHPSELQVSKHSQLIEEYISNNYHEYGVPDPMPRNAMMKGHRRHLSSVQGEKIRRIDLLSNHLSEQQESGLKEQLSQRADIKRILKTEPDQLQTGYCSTKKRILTTGLSEKGGKTEKQVIKLKPSAKKHNPRSFDSTGDKAQKSSYLVREFSGDETSLQFEGVDLHGSRIGNKQTESIMEQRRTTFPLQSISERFRFCLGCEQSVLQANIPYHESICNQFQFILSHSWEHMLATVENRLNQLHSTLTVGFNRPSLDQDSRVLGMRLIDEAETFQREGFSTSSFEKTIQSLCQNMKDSVDLMENLSKLGWLLRIHRAVKQKLKK